LYPRLLGKLLVSQKMYVNLYASSSLWWWTTESAVSVLSKELWGRLRSICLVFQQTPHTRTSTTGTDYWVLLYNPGYFVCHD
jgi:hypothetical protein